MSYQGTIKSMGKDYGFIDCPPVSAQYGRDVFIHKAMVGIDMYTSLNQGEVVKFELVEDAKGQPTAGNIQIAGKGGGPPKGAPGMMKGKGPPMGGFKGKGPPPAAQGGSPYPRPSWMPAAGQLVTLGDGVGWFIPVEAIEPEYPQAVPFHAMAGPPMMAGMKRPAEKGWDMAPKKPKGGGKGFKGPPGPAAENPGLDESAQAFTGTIKHVPNGTTGYGFIQDDNVAALYGGKDAFLHMAVCPWVEQMELQIGDIVHFNVELNEKQAPQVTRIVKAQ
jgi:cold shock CspA family protein